MPPGASSDQQCQSACCPVAGNYSDAETRRHGAAVDLQDKDVDAVVIVGVAVAAATAATALVVVAVMLVAVVTDHSLRVVRGRPGQNLRE